ncbi:MAG: hypothetical protein ACLTOZ_00120, partial [[Clostridium] leptum]
MAFVLALKAGIFFVNAIQVGVMSLPHPIFSVFIWVSGLFRGDFSKPPYLDVQPPKEQKQQKTASLFLNCTLFVRQYDILNNKWG